MNHCKNCGEMIAAGRQYCSRACKDSSQQKYNENTRQFVANNIGRMHLKTLARTINVTRTGLKRQISAWRSEGYDIGGSRYAHYSKS